MSVSDSYRFTMSKPMWVVLAILSFTSASWIDPDTQLSDKFTISAVDGRTYELVFSDEFDVEGRSFKDGSDPKWTAMHKDDYTNFALHYYNSDLVTTKGGVLNISTIVKDITFNVESKTKKTETKTKNYQSAMIQGWNKFCFTGGIVEISAQLPGKYDIGGLWPAMWLLGNLARATYVGSSNNMWPWSYDTCSKIFQHQQLISACNAVNHYGIQPFKGRGAPEIDLLEAMSGLEDLPNTKIHRPYFSTSLQVAPGIQEYRPDVAKVPEKGMWYEKGLEYASNETDLNIFFFGMNLEGVSKDKSYLADAISANTNLYETHFTKFHNYRLEWVPGPKGYIKWYLDDEYLYGISHEALNMSGAIIPEEPMYLLLNTAVSSTWGFPAPCPADCPCDCFDPRKSECACAIPARMMESLPAHFLIDYVRVYQAVGDFDQIVGCSTPSHPTSTYIKGHQHEYKGEKDKEMLLPVPTGGAKCSSNNDCGGTRGTCVKNACQCNVGTTGPNCLAAVAFDDIKWEKVEPIGYARMKIPSALSMLAVGLLCLFMAAVVYKYAYDRSNRGNWRSPSSQVGGGPGASPRSYVRIPDAVEVGASAAQGGRIEMGTRRVGGPSK